MRRLNRRLGKAERAQHRDGSLGTLRFAQPTNSAHSLLKIHPDFLPGVVVSIQVEIAILQTGALKMTYVLSGDLDALRLPEVQPAGRADSLWQHTCFEAFIRAADSPAYREFNFSPSGQWQAYAFTDTRVGGLLEPAADPLIECVAESGRLMPTLTLTATIQAADLPPGNVLRIGLAAVVESVAGDIGYWALQHAAGKPDFHHPDTFALEIELT